MISGLQSVSAAVGNLTSTTNFKTSLIPPSEQTADRGVSPFGDLFQSVVGKVNDLEDQARTTVNGFITGTGVDVHDVMIASEKASMAFEMALAVRNKAIQSYQSVMSMQF